MISRRGPNRSQSPRSGPNRSQSPRNRKLPVNSSSEDPWSWSARRKSNLCTPMRVLQENPIPARPVVSLAPQSLMQSGAVSIQRGRSIESLPRETLKMPSRNVKSDAAKVDCASMNTPPVGWAFLSDVEIAQFARASLDGLVAPELLEKLSRRDIVSLLTARFGESPQTFPLEGEQVADRNNKVVHECVGHSNMHVRQGPQRAVSRNSRQSSNSPRRSPRPLSTSPRRSPRPVSNAAPPQPQTQWKIAAYPPSPKISAALPVRAPSRSNSQITIRQKEIGVTRTSSGADGARTPAPLTLVPRPKVARRRTPQCEPTQPHMPDRMEEVTQAPMRGILLQQSSGDRGNKSDALIPTFPTAGKDLQASQSSLVIVETAIDDIPSSGDPNALVSTASFTAQDVDSSCGLLCNSVSSSPAIAACASTVTTARLGSPAPGQNSETEFPITSTSQLSGSSASEEAALTSPEYGLDQKQKEDAKDLRELSAIVSEENGLEPEERDISRLGDSTMDVGEQVQTVVIEQHTSIGGLIAEAWVETMQEERDRILHGGGNEAKLDEWGRETSLGIIHERPVQKNPSRSSRTTASSRSKSASMKSIATKKDFEDSEAAALHLMNLADTRSKTGCLTVTEMQTFLRGTPHEEFMQWITKTRQWLKYDTSRSGTVEIKMLKSALREFYASKIHFKQISPSPRRSVSPKSNGSRQTPVLAMEDDYTPRGPLPIYQGSTTPKPPLRRTDGKADYDAERAKLQGALKQFRSDDYDELLATKTRELQSLQRRTEEKMFKPSQARRTTSAAEQEEPQPQPTARTDRAHNSIFRNFELQDLADKCDRLSETLLAQSQKSVVNEKTRAVRTLEFSPSQSSTTLFSMNE